MDMESHWKISSKNKNTISVAERKMNGRGARVETPIMLL